MLDGQAGRLGKQQSYRGEWYETKIIRPQDVQDFVKWVRSLDFTEVQCKVIGNCSAGGCVLFLETHSGRCGENGWWEVQRWSWETGCEAAALSGWKMMVTLVEWKEMVGFIVWLFGNRVNGTWLWINMGVEEKRITFIVPSYDTISIYNYGNFGREFKFFGDFGYSFVTCAVLLSCDRLFCDPMDCSPWDCPWNFPGKNAGVGCHFLLQRIFPTQGLNSCLLHWQGSSLPLHQSLSL